MIRRGQRKIARVLRSAGFQTCCVADFQVGRVSAHPRPASLETCGPAGWEACATVAVSRCAPDYKKNSKEFDLSAAVAYKCCFGDMDYRCSSSLAGLALLIGGSCAVWTPCARAGDRIEFSAPAIPLAIPQPEVEVKEPQRPFSSISAAEGPVEDSYMVPPQNIAVAKPRTRQNDPWDDNPLRDDQDPRNADDLFTARLQPNRLTNGMSLNTQRAWDAKDSDHLLSRRGDSKLDSSYAIRFGLDKDNLRDGDRFGRDYVDEKSDSFLSKVFGRDTAGPDRFNAWGTTPFPGDPKNSAGVETEERKKSFGPAADAVRPASLPPGYGSYDPQDIRQNGEQAGATQSYIRAWEPPPSRPTPSRSYSHPNQSSPSRVVAPNRPVNLDRPKRPGDSNPF
jgi:hypothetical protein